MKKPKKNWLEWAWFIFSALLVSALMIYLGHQALTSGEKPPDISFQFHPAEPRGDKFLVKLVAHNRGDLSAEGVHVEVTLTADGKEEQARLIIDHLPRHGTREAYVTFSADPRRGSLRARALGFQES